ncbi:uncharacterized protein LOC132736947 [Ruditapes philippinarum]|uniref:uncharacterized protein LOC132736947 n=1 Tax=Ruditapes philippinarum TaxID=129788 RepID=UPI00295C21EE|nr:uncharacterized protein LOC132736947 [Ruditapes philippinarum]
MKPCMNLISAMILAAVCNLFMFLPYGYVMDNDVDSDVIIDALHNDDTSDADTNTDWNDIELTDNRKRAQLSLTGGLRSLADMVYSQRSNERNAHRNALLSLGKRNFRLPFFKINFGRFAQSYPSTSSVSRRRSQQLSVSGPLSALANMLAAEGRRRKQSESFNNRMKLLEIGKRTSEVSHVGLSDIDSDLQNNDYL